MFGPRLRFSVGELIIELAALCREVMGEFISPGMQLLVVTQYLGRRTAPVLEDEYEWFDKMRQQTDSVLWGIWDVTVLDERKLIGTTAIHQIGSNEGPICQASTGSMIFRPEYWRKGIASAAHKVRTWYAFEQLGICRLKSAAVRPNIASRKALERSGYFWHSTEYNFTYGSGQMQHADNLECLNPKPFFWRQWWDEERPTSRAIAARTRTEAALEWASSNVKFD